MLARQCQTFLIYDGDDGMLKLLLQYVIYNDMRLAYDHRVRYRTCDTHKALYLTLNGIVHMSKMFLTEYLLLGYLQSDRIEGEFGVSLYIYIIKRSKANLVVQNYFWHLINLRMYSASIR